MSKPDEIITSTTNGVLRLHFGGGKSFAEIKDIPLYQIAKVFERIEEFINTEKISCGEDVYQNENVEINGIDFIYDLCEIVGYYKYPDEELDKKE